jgi:two-component system copper resistance phosphate regulon response regulator CusR
MRILVVEDEPKVAAALKEDLEAEQYEVALAQTGEDAFFQATNQPFDLVVLDVMLPGRSGIEILQALRRSGIGVRVLVLTARDTVEDRVLGLDSGADDYLVKPFALAELLARIRALMRREPGPPDAKRRVADLELDCANRRVTRGGQVIDLTPREYDLLEYLSRQPGRAVSRETLARDVWRVQARATPLDNVIDVHVARLRKKLDEPFEPKLLRTIRGLGFVLADDAASGEP